MGFGVEDLLLIDYPSKTACIRKAKEKLLETEKLYSCLTSNGKDVNNENKLRIYRLYKSTFQTETYVKLNMSRDQRRILSKFRSCNLPLAIETGRYTKPKTPLNDRICGFCSATSVEDEIHF